MSPAQDPWQDPRAQQWIRDIRERVVPKMDESAYVATLVPESVGGEIDVQFAVEIGLAILLDKPLIACIEPGTAVPPKLAAIADRIVEADYRAGEAGMADLARRMKNAMDELEAEGVA